MINIIYEVCVVWGWGGVLNTCSTHTHTCTHSYSDGWIANTPRGPPHIGTLAPHPLRPHTHMPASLDITPNAPLPSPGECNSKLYLGQNRM